jgi:hypothetical protein
MKDPLKLAAIIISSLALFGSVLMGGIKMVTAYNELSIALVEVVEEMKNIKTSMTALTGIDARVEKLELFQEEFRKLEGISFRVDKLEAFKENNQKTTQDLAVLTSTHAALLEQVKALTQIVYELDRKLAYMNGNQPAPGRIK